eukprot:Em0008g971a
MLASLYNGNVHVWNHETQALVKSFEVTDLPVRVAKFVVRKSWVVAGSDDMQVRIFNYNTLEKVHSFEAHSDYIRSIIVHPTHPYILTSSDDMTIKLWDWDKKWACSQVFEGHSHYVMMIVLNPKDNNQFASASLDRTIKVWQLGSPHPNFTLEGHDKGVNCVDYFQGGEKPYLISGADDKLVKIWDYQNKTCVQTLEGHAQNVTCAIFHSELPIIMTGSEDGTVKIWHANMYKLETTLNYGLERVWCIAQMKGSNDLAIGYDEGSVMVKMGREEPAISMDNTGKIIWAHHCEMQQANLKNLNDVEIKDGERLPLSVKDMGSCEIYPQTISHSSNGRFVVVCGDGEYIIYTAMALRNKSFGSGQEFVWAADPSEYAIREGTSRVKLYKNFKERKAFKPDSGVEGIFGGTLLGVRSTAHLTFYDWENQELIRRIEIAAKHVYWNDSGDHVSLSTNQGVTDDGVESAFTVEGEVQDSVRTAAWVGDCFIYTNSINRLNYYVGGEVVTVSHLDRVMYLLGYIPKESRLYLGDKELNIVSYSIQLSVLEYQTAIMRKDFDTADKVLPSIPVEQRARVAHFLEKQGFKTQALAVSTDIDHKFELAIQLKDVRVAYELAKKSESAQKWKQLSELAIAKSQFGLAMDCLYSAKDYSGLMLLASSAGDATTVDKIATVASSEGQNNLAFMSNFLLGRLEECLEILVQTKRLPEAAFFCRTYLPSQTSRVVQLWKEALSKSNPKGAQSIADPSEYENLFPDFSLSLQAEQYLKQERAELRPASEYPTVKGMSERKILEEAKTFTEVVVPTGVKQPEDPGSQCDLFPQSQCDLFSQSQCDLFSQSQCDLFPSPNVTSSPSPNSQCDLFPQSQCDLFPQSQCDLFPSPNVTSSPSPNVTSSPSPNVTSSPSPNVTSSPSPNVTSSPSPNVTSSPSPNVTSSPSPNVTSSPSPNVASSPSPNVTSSPSPNDLNLDIDNELLEPGGGDGGGEDIDWDDEDLLKD